MIEMVNRVSQLLRQIELSLTENGAIRSITDVHTIVASMEQISTMESRCTFINILLNTSSKPILVEFVSIGGWKIINKWLNDVMGYSEADSMFVEEILYVLLKLPVTMDLLKQEKSIPLFIKNLSKNSKFNDEVQRLSSEIVKAWTLVITTEAKLIKKTTQDHASSDQKSKDDVKRKKSNSESKGENIDPAKVKKQHAPPSSGPRKTGLEEQELNKVIPKKRPSADAEKVTDIKKPKMENTVSMEKQVTNESLAAKVVNTTDQHALKTANHDMQKQVEKIIGGDSKTKPSEKNVNSKVDKEPKAPNIENPKQKSVALSQSTSFADALFKPAQVATKPKVKSKVKKTTVESKPKTTSSVSTQKLPDSSVVGSSKKPVNENSSSDKTEKVENDKIFVNQPESKTDDKSELMEEIKETVTEDISESENKETESCWDPQIASVPKPILVYHRSKKKTNRVKFKDDDNLVMVEYFEIEEGERTNFRKQEAMYNQDYAKIEMMREKMTMQQMREGHLDRNSFTSYSDWHLHVLEFPDSFDQSLLVRGAASVEREVQNRREIGVLAELHFDRSRIPSSPKEPDPETFEQSEPVIIPLGDLSKVTTLPLPPKQITKEEKSLDVKSPGAFPDVSKQEPLSVPDVVKNPQQAIPVSTVLPPPVTESSIKVFQEPPVTTAAADQDFRTLTNQAKPILSTTKITFSPPNNPTVTSPPPVCQSLRENPITTKPEVSKSILPDPVFNPNHTRLPYPQQTPANPAFDDRNKMNNFPMRPGPGPVLNNRDPFFQNQQRFAPYNRPPIRPHFNNNRGPPPVGIMRPPNQTNQFQGPPNRTPVPLNRNQAPLNRNQAPLNRNQVPRNQVALHRDQAPRNLAPAIGRAPLDASQVCIHYAQGHCKFGDRCTYFHVPRGPPPDPKMEESSKDLDLRDYLRSWWFVISLTNILVVCFFYLMEKLCWWSL